MRPVAGHTATQQAPASFPLTPASRRITLYMATRCQALVSRELPQPVACSLEVSAGHLLARPVAALKGYGSRIDDTQRADQC